MMEFEKRIGLGPIPSSPKDYLNVIQVNGMSILSKFGWRLVCIRRPSIEDVETVIRSSLDGSVGILGKDGILRLSQNLKVRDRAMIGGQVQN